jgi:hypothetical protein
MADWQPVRTIENSIRLSVAIDPIAIKAGILDGVENLLKKGKR